MLESQQKEINPRRYRHHRSLSAAARGADRYLGLVILLAGGLLVAGWTLPVMTISKLIFFAERISIIEGAQELWSSGNYFLFAIVVVFSIVFPALKMVLAIYLWYRVDINSKHLHRSLNWIETLGRWSMLDVFVVALIVVSVQVSLVNDVDTHPGIYVFTAAVVLSMLAVRRLTILARRAAATAQKETPD